MTQATSKGPHLSHREVLFALAWALGLLLAAPSTAHADYELCNATSYVLDAAIAHKQGRGFRSEGWTRLEPGVCATAVDGAIRNEEYYVYARSPIAYDGAIKRFAGTELFCIDTGDFAIDGRGNCAERGLGSANFLRILTETGKSWTTTLSEAQDYSLEEAKVAGIQRLLQENGAETTQIDGIDGGRTDHAIAAFQEAHGLDADGEITPALCAALVEAAAKTQAQTGLSFCNESDDLAWVALAYELGDTYESNGWIRVPAGECRKAVYESLADRAYFYVAEPNEGDTPETWKGEETFCVRDTRFSIRDRTDCAERGYQVRGFRAVEKSGEALTVVPLN